LYKRAGKPCQAEILIFYRKNTIIARNACKHTAWPSQFWR
jgi:hypothetical protein